MIRRVCLVTTLFLCGGLATLHAETPPNPGSSQPQVPAQACKDEAECRGARALGAGSSSLRLRAGNIGGVQQYRGPATLVKPGGEMQKDRSSAQSR